jgi:hypothetical protein
VAVLTTTGKQWVVDKMRETIGAGQTQRWVGWGTGAGAEAAGNTALTTPAAEARVSGVITSPSAALHRVVASITSASGQTITEVGLFDLVTIGTMMVRALLGVSIPVLTGDIITFTIDFTQT